MRRLDSHFLVLALALSACKADGGEANADTDASSSSGTGDPSGDSGDPSGSPTSAGSATTASTTMAPTTSADTTVADDDDTSEPDSTGDPDVTGDPDTGPIGEAIYEEDFAGNDGEAWPAPWVERGDGILTSELDGERGRLQAVSMYTARMVLPGFDEVDADVYVTVTFESPSTQGFGFYCRQNGGALQATDPPGQGYAVFLEGAYMRAIGIWREIDGVEELLQNTPDAVEGNMQPGVPYRVRLQCLQNGATTTVRAKVWPAGDEEPAQWRVSVDDDTPQLQDLAGSFAADIYNYGGTGSIFVDDVFIAAM